MSGAPQVRHQWGRSPPSQPPNASRGPSPKMEVPPGAVCRVRFPTPASHRHRYSDGENDALLDFGKTIPQERQNTPNPTQQLQIPKPFLHRQHQPRLEPASQKKSQDQRTKTQGGNACMLHNLSNLHSPHGHGDGASPPPFSFLVTAAPRGPGSGSVRDLGSGVRASQPAIQAEAGSIETPDSATPGRGATPGRVTRSVF